ncbi:hypothetical protein AB0D27_26480 [Streptomyces sp. NPDC048415]
MRRDGVMTYLELGPGEALAPLLDGCPPDGSDSPRVLSTARDRPTLHGS